MNQNTFYIGAVVFLALSYAVAYYAMKEEPIRSKQDLTVITSKLKRYSFQDNENGVNQKVGYNTYFELHGYDNRFQIPNAFKDFFNKVKFEEIVNVNDLVTVQIRQVDKDKLNSGRRVDIYSMSRGGRTLLNLEETMFQERFSKYIFKPFMAVVFLGLGILCFIYGRKLWIRAEQEMVASLVEK